MPSEVNMQTCNSSKLFSFGIITVVKNCTIISFFCKVLCDHMNLKIVSWCPLIFTKLQRPKGDPVKSP